MTLRSLRRPGGDAADCPVTDLFRYSACDVSSRRKAYRGRQLRPPIPTATDPIRYRRSSPGSPQAVTRLTTTPPFKAGTWKMRDRRAARPGHRSISSRSRPGKIADGARLNQASALWSEAARGKGAPAVPKFSTMPPQLCRRPTMISLGGAPTHLWAQAAERLQTRRPAYMATLWAQPPRAEAPAQIACAS